MIKKVTAVILALTLILLNAYSINAAGTIGEMETGVSGMNRLTVVAALNDYFNSRKAFLLGQTDTINVPLVGVIEDETSHREKYELEEVVFVDSVISIGNVTVFDKNAFANVTEMVTFIKAGDINTATVSHELFLGFNNDSGPVVISDQYKEDFLNFRSCSYVNEDSSVVTNMADGSGSCIVHVAEQQLGYTERDDGYTVYGAWFDGLYGEILQHDFTNETWCVMFVSWCAAHANISRTVIEHKANESQMLTFFNDQLKYYPRSTAESTQAPKAGDIVFFTENGINPSHVGIVCSANASYIYVVHGNWSNSVCYTTFARTDSYILGYAKPAYATTGHSTVSEYERNVTQHWLCCDNCGCEYEKGAHSLPNYYVDNATHHWKVCSTCGQETAREAHILEDVHAGWVFMCTECGYIEENWGTWEGS